MPKKVTVKVLKKPDVTDLAGEKVMIDFDSGKYFMLIGPANEIWDMLENGKSSEDIVRELMAIYEIDEETCRADVLKFLNELVDIEFVSIEECPD